MQTMRSNCANSKSKKNMQQKMKPPTLTAGKRWGVDVALLLPLLLDVCEWDRQCLLNHLLLHHHISNFMERTKL